MTRAARAHLFAEIEQVWQTTRRAVRVYMAEQVAWTPSAGCLCELCQRVRAMRRETYERKRKS